MSRASRRCSTASDLDQRRLQRSAVERLERQRQQLQHPVAEGLARQLEGVALAGQLRDWYNEGRELRPFSLSYMYDGDPGFSAALPLLSEGAAHEAGKKPG